MLRAVLGCHHDVTIPEEQYNLLSTTETGNTIESSAFLDLDREAREGYEEVEVAVVGRDESGHTHEEGGAISTEVVEDFILLDLKSKEVHDFAGAEQAVAMEEEFESNSREAYENSVGVQSGEVDGIFTHSERSQAAHEGQGAMFMEVVEDQVSHLEGEEREDARRGVEATFKRGGEAISKELAGGRYPTRRVTQRTTVEDKTDEDEEEAQKNIYDFQEDSFDDKDYVPDQRDQLKVYSPSKPLKEVKCSKKGSAAPKETETMRTPPEVFKARRDPKVEESWRQAGGHTPDQSKAKPNKSGTFDKDLLRMLVHMLAKSRQIDLSKDPLKPAFFKDLVSLYGNLPNTNSAKLAPYTSHQYVQKKWRELFCTKKVTKTGSVQADVHKFDYPQESSIPCQLCSEPPQNQSPDPRDHMLQRLSDQLNQRQESHKVSVGKAKAKGEKEPCPHCHKYVADLKRHIKENCRANKNNLVECPQCKMMIVKRSLPEHLNGRLDKKTGAVINQPCKGNNEDGQSKKEMCPTCGILVKNLQRHIKERHIKKGPVQSSRVLESLGGKRPAESAAGGKDAKKQKQGETPFPQKPKQTINLSEEAILRTLEDWIFKFQQKQSMEDQGGINQEEMDGEAIRFLENSLGIRASGPPFEIDLNGDCLYNSVSFIANPGLSKEENAHRGTAVRKAVMEEVIQVIRTMSSDTLEPILAVAADNDKEKTREELLSGLERYKNNGTWDGALGDLGPQLCASFTRTPLFVIWIDLANDQTTGYFVNPAHVFNQPEHISDPTVVIRQNNHYVPLSLPEEAKEGLREIYRHSQNHEMQLAAIRLPVTCKNGGGRIEKRRDRTPSPDSSKRTPNKSGGNTGGMPQQRQQQHVERGGCTGNDTKCIKCGIVQQLC